MKFLKNARHLKFSSLKIKEKVRLLFLVILSIYLVGAFLLFSVVLREQIFAYAIENNKKAIATVGTNLTSEIEKINNFSRQLLINKELVNYLEGDPNKKLNDYIDAANRIYELQNAYADAVASSVLVFRTDGNYMTVGRGVTYVDEDLIDTPNWLGPIQGKKGGYILSVNGNGAFRTSYNKTIISMIRIVNDTNNNAVRGMLAVNFPLETFEKTYQEAIGGGRHFAYLDENGELLCSDQAFEASKLSFVGRNETGIYTSEGFFKKTVYAYQKIPNSEFVLVSYEDVSVFQQVGKEIYVAVILLFLFTVFVIIVIGAFISVYITTPINKLVESMSSVKDGWLRRVSIHNSDDEIGLLKDSYNSMLVSTNELIEQLIDKEKSIRQAEIELLQEQIKPHFLYNTLEMIASLSVDAKREEIYDALETLGSFYRQFLSKGNSEVTLKTEISIVSDYLKIQKMRYGDIFDVSYHIEEKCNSQKVPKLLLQPLVENCIYHGIRPKGERGYIHIMSRMIDEEMILEISDNGVGMSGEQLQTILNGETTSFGLKKTVERFQYYAGNKGRFEVTTDEGEGFRIVFYLKIEP